MACFYLIFVWQIIITIKQLCWPKAAPHNYFGSSFLCRCPVGAAFAQECLGLTILLIGCLTLVITKLLTSPEKYWKNMISRRHWEFYMLPENQPVRHLLMI